MIFPSLSTGLAALVSFGALSASAAPALSARDASNGLFSGADCGPGRLENPDGSLVPGLPALPPLFEEQQGSAIPGLDLSSALNAYLSKGAAGGREYAVRAACDLLPEENFMGYKRDGPEDVLSLVTGLKDTVGDILAQVTALGDAGKLNMDSGSDILGQLTSALTSATSSAGSLPAGSVPASEPNETSALGTQVATLVTEILRDVVAIVARLGALPLLGPLLLAVDGLLVSLLTALAPVVGGLLANVSTLVFSLGGSNLAGLISNLGLGLTAGLLTLAV